MSARPTVLLTNAMHPEGEALLRAETNLVIAPDVKAETLRALAKDAHGIIARAKLPDDVVDHAPNLKGMVRHGVGLDFIPVAAATRKKLPVANLPGSNTQAVAEHVIAALFHLRRPLSRADAAFRTGGWDDGRKATDSFGELGGTTLGIIGVGAIGGRIAGIARNGFGMTVLGTSRQTGKAREGVETVELADLLRRSDAIAVTCALTDETRGLVSRDMIALMKPGAVIVNVSRGPVLDTAAVIDALREGRMGGAALDVFDVQPLPADDPLFGAPNLLLTPHAASFTATSVRLMGIGSAQEMLRILRGERPLNLVNPEILE
jgi:D-3-phosphoglycerate dehydrogenase